MRKTDIVTQRLILKELTYDDLAFVHELNTSPLVAQYNTLSIPTNTEQTREWMSIEIEDQEDEIRHRFCWTLFLIENNTPCGLIGLKLSPRRLNFGEINYAILPQFWGFVFI
ncbi:MAG: GNAT family N-acetyltransferase [Bacteroidales bacterium]|nr:GNAT family N-acetyltransferase [Bacteroidales bacterium]